MDAEQDVPPTAPSPEPPKKKRGRPSKEVTTALANSHEVLVPRRRPMQARSRERYERILASARAALVELGFESFTFDAVAQRADVPIGTLYQFFANKYVLVCELDRQDSAGIVSELETFASRVPALQWPEFLDEFIDHVAMLWRNDPSRRAVWHAVQSTPQTRFTAADTETAVLDLIANAMAPLAPAAAPEQRRQLAGILLHTVTSMLNYAVRDPEINPEVFEATVTEIKRMLVAYLFAVATG